MTDKVIDFNEFLKKKQGPESEEYYQRMLKCIQNEKLNGTCSCDICSMKNNMSDQLIKICQSMIVDYMQTSKNNVYYGDQFEIFVMAAIKMKEICHKPEL